MLRVGASFLLSSGPPGRPVPDERRAWRLGLCAVTVLAAALRLGSLDHQLPYLPLPGEDKALRVTLTMLYQGTPNPGFFHYPSLPFYLYAVAFELWQGLFELLTQDEVALGVVERVALGVARVQQPALVMLARAIVALAGVGTAILSAQAARSLSGSVRTGWLAGGLVAVSPLLVEYGQIARHDGFVPLLAAACLLACARYLADGGARYLALAGVAVGLGASCKYNAVALAVLPVVTVLLGVGPRGLLRLLPAAVLAGAAFAVTSPYVLLDLETARVDVLYELEHYASDHLGRDRSGGWHYPRTLLTREGPMVAAGALGLVLGVRQRRPAALLAAAVPVVYGLIIQRLPVQVDRMLLPLLPSLAVLAALGVAHVARRRRGAAALLVAACLGWGAVGAIQTGRQLRAPDARHDARAWLATHLAPGSRVALESFGPFVNPRRHDVQQVPAGRGFSALWVQSPEWYRDQGFDVLVRSSGTSGRYREAPERYPDAVPGYRALADAFVLWQQFEGGGKTVWVYRVDQSQAAHR
jgi:hypothetical protein